MLPWIGVKLFDIQFLVIARTVLQRSAEALEHSRIVTTFMAKSVSIGLFVFQYI